MKNTFALLVFIQITLSGFSQITNPDPYCSGTFDGGISGAMMKYISKVEIDEVSWQHVSGNANPSPGYTYFNNIEAPVVQQGNTYTFTVTHSGIAIHFVTVFIDFNGNNTFDVAEGEAFFETANTPEFEFPTSPTTFSITIPNDALNGTTRMRVQVFEDDDYTWNLFNNEPPPCTAYAAGQMLDYGETEDYDLVIGSETIAIQPGSIATDLIVSPNPASDYWSIQLASDAVYHIDLYSINGEKLISYTSSLPLSIPATDLPSGAYILHLSDDKGRFSYVHLLKH